MSNQIVRVMISKIIGGGKYAQIREPAEFELADPIQKDFPSAMQALAFIRANYGMPEMDHDCLTFSRFEVNGLPASFKDMEDWKLGKKKISHAVYSFFISTVTEKALVGKDLSEVFPHLTVAGLEISENQ